MEPSPFIWLIMASCSDAPASMILWCQGRATGLDKPPPPGRIPALSVGCVAVCPPPPQAVSWLPRPLTSQSSAAAETLKTHWNVDYTCLFRWKFSYIITLSYVPASAFASVCVFNLQWTSDNNSYISSCLYFSFVVAFPGLLLHCWAGSTATLI